MLFQVRVKPKQSKIEVDLSLDVDSENYDRDVDELLRIEKQVIMIVMLVVTCISCG